MKILITGSYGFIGKNLVCKLVNDNYSVIEYDLNSSVYLEEAINQCDLVVHLAGINRPLTSDEFYDGNVNFTKRLVDSLKVVKREVPIIFASSIQVNLDNDYGRSKLLAEKLITDYGKDMGVKTCILRLSNVFGKWCKPNYNSVVATFCYKIARNEEIMISDQNAVIPFVYIDDVVNMIVDLISEKKEFEELKEVNPIYNISLGELAKTLYSFNESRNTKFIPKIEDEFAKKLYSTYLSYLPEDNFGYKLKMNIDNRGSFTEFLKTNNFGQVSVNVSKPGVVKGNHWHHTKNEKFLVVSGKAVIAFRKIGGKEVIKYSVSSDELEVIDIPCGYTHNIQNVGENDLVTMIWANELFNEEDPDTYYEEV